MRILAVEPGPQFSVQDVHAGWVKALAASGAQVVDYNLADRLTFYSGAHIKRGARWRPALKNDDAIALAAKGVEAVAFEVWPDVVVFTSAFFIPQYLLELLRFRNMKTVILMTESPYEDETQIRKAPYADVVLLNDPTNLAQFRTVNPNTHYLSHAFDPDVHYRRPGDPAKASDFCFVGTGFPSRVEFFEQVDWTGIDIALAGNWLTTKAGSEFRPDGSPLAEFVLHPLDHCLDNTDAIDLYSNAKASANLYRREAQRPELSVGWACGPREIELAATGCFFLRDRRPEGDALFPMLPTFDGPEEFEDKLRWWLAHDSEREDAAQAAQAAVADRTFDQNAKRLLSILESL